MLEEDASVSLVQRDGLKSPQLLKASEENYTKRGRMIIKLWEYTCVGGIRGGSRAREDSKVHRVGTGGEEERGVVIMR